ncbi:transcriptional regulator [Psychromonas sp. CNPT3]|uniref:sigma-54 interaction domain-containing protein n=1 Tax=Psychromonas sp. CNPT3 TaxID=314282 RepID=UPI00006E85F1|nr:sigma-54 dependent transcriptional regulator [Psychromonas sp. CNPT3]AGH81621.1 transcriptional regulator [Psychromonas sp. CNPT3]
MVQWLKIASELTAIHDCNELALKFIEALKTELHLSAAHILFPCADGRNLMAINHPQKLLWGVNDFDSPFAHALQSASLMRLDAKRLLYWRSNSAFCALMSNISRTDSVLILPLCEVENKVKALLVVMAPPAIIDAVLAENDCIQFSKLFLRHWQMIQDKGQQENQKTVLNESITRLRQQESQRGMSINLTSKLIGSSDLINRLRTQIVTAAQSGLSVLIQGETGTGKELVARAVHDLSARNKGSFIAINCAATPESLLESEWFGHAKGAFSGAERKKKGLVEEADGGTLFLDEIGDMPLALQAKLLRVLETHKFRPVGSEKEISSDFRLVAATHVNLRSRVESGDFRHDLYYRLYQYPLLLPTLKERADDISELALHFVDKFNEDHKTNIRGICYSALDHLCSYSFPGNVRELRHLIEFACAQTANGEEVGIESFDDRALILGLETDISMTAVDEVKKKKKQIIDIRNLKLALQNYEREIIRSRLLQFSGDRTKAAESLGLPKRTLAGKCLKFKLKVK